MGCGCRRFESYYPEYQTLMKTIALIILTAGVACGNTLPPSWENTLPPTWENTLPPTCGIITSVEA